MEISRVWRAKIMEYNSWIQGQDMWMRRRRRRMWCRNEFSEVMGAVERWRLTRGSRGDGEMDIRGRNGGGGEDSWGDGERECSASEIGVRHATVHQHHTLHLHLDQWEDSVDKQSKLSKRQRKEIFTVPRWDELEPSKPVIFWWCYL